MDLLKETKELCAFYHIKPSPTKGQNFLVRSEVYERIVKAAKLKSDDLVLEVGPGLGFLTMALAEHVQRVVAVELDDKLASLLPERLRSFAYNNIQIIHDNVLNWPRLAGIKAMTDFKVVANLPYNITAIFLRKFLSEGPRPESLTLMLQDEVARRITARPGDMSLLALSVQYYAQAEYIFKVPASDFYPAPKVNSAVVSLVVKKQLPLGAEEEKLMFRLARIGFAARRKMLKGNLLNVIKIKPELMTAALEENKIDIKARAQDLSVEQWLGLLGSLRAYMV